MHCMVLYTVGIYCVYKWPAATNITTCGECVLNNPSLSDTLYTCIALWCYKPRYHTCICIISAFNIFRCTIHIHTDRYVYTIGFSGATAQEICMFGLWTYLITLYFGGGTLFQLSRDVHSNELHGAWCKSPVIMF